MTDIAKLLKFVPKIEDLNPGLEPTGFNVLVAPAVVEEKIGSIIILESAQEKETIRRTLGRLVATSPVAFDFSTWPDPAAKPQAGDTVLFASLAGFMVKGRDGVDYRLMHDKDICAVVKETADA